MLLVQLGDAAEAQSAWFLRDTTSSEAVRRELPRVLATMGASSADYLAGQLVHEHTGVVAYRRARYHRACCQLMTERPYKAGETLWAAGDVTQTGIFVADGIVRCTQPDGQAADAHATATLGFLDHLVLDQMSLTAVATTDVVVLELPVQALVEAMETHMDLAYAVIQSMGAAVVELPILLEARVVLASEAS